MYLSYLYRVDLHQENQMTSMDLGYVLSPILMRSDAQAVEDSFAIMYIQNAIVTFLIDEYEKIFL